MGDLTQATDALAAPPASGYLAKSLPVQITALVGLNEYALQPFRIRASRKVKQHSLSDDHRNSPLESDFVLEQAPRLMQPDSSVPFCPEST